MLDALADTVVTYPFDDTPDAGSVMRLLPGVRWLRMPLPFALAHINLWLLEESAGFVIVDTGVHTDKSRDIWRSVLDGELRGGPVDRVFVTHLHPDHAGCAGWLCRSLEAELWMSREEYLLCRVLTADTGRETPPEGIRFYRAAGFPPEALDRYQQMFGMFGRFVVTLPDAYRRLKDGDRIDVGRLSWEVVVGRGHSPEHACLYCESENVLISGDQLLPTISSNVSVYPTEPAADPLADWLRSLRDMQARVPADVLVLPSHGRPFVGAHGRLEQLIDEHESALDELLVLCRSRPQRVVDVFPALFRSQVRDSQLIMATGEAIAHLNYLRCQGLITRYSDEDGVHWYRADG